MQIHELDNYNGNLDTGAFLAIDDGSDTGRISAAGFLNEVKQDIADLDATLNGRIDNIIAGGTAPSAAEVTDARQGADGITYASLGSAIRTQITNLTDRLINANNGIEEVTAPLLGRWFLAAEKGGIDPNTGALTTSQNRARTQYIPLQDGMIINVDNLHQYVVRYYDNTETLVGITPSWRTDSINVATISYRPASATQFRLVVANRDDSDASSFINDINSVINVMTGDATLMNSIGYSIHSIPIVKEANDKRIQADGTIVDLAGFYYSELIDINQLGDYEYIGVNASTLKIARIHGYDDEGNWLCSIAAINVVAGTPSNPQTTTEHFRIPSGVTKIRISSSNYLASETLTVGESLFDYVERNITALEPNIPTYEPYQSGVIGVQYYIDNDGHYNRGQLMLPTSYSPTGAPIPMIVHVHSSSVFPDITSNMWGSDAGLANLEYLRDCGYAVFDCYGFGNVYDRYTGGYSNTWGIPLNRKCYKSGIEYVCKHYNIDPKNIFVSCKSLGGLQAISMFYDEGIPIKAFGLLAPELDCFNTYMGYSSTNKKAIASDLDFSEDINGVLNFEQGDPVPAGFWNYITENMEKWIGAFAIWCGLPILAADKPTYYRNMINTGSMFRTSLNRPMKIWHAADDSSVNYNGSKAFINSLVNAGYSAELRTMPSGTGGHLSVDIADNRPMTSDVTTRLGVHYASVTTAYYELAQWFDMWATK